MNSVGEIGENIACGYLEKKGYKIINRNFSTPFGEIDIIAKDIDNMPVFVEVKAATISGNRIPIAGLSYPQPYSPEMHLSPKKIKTLSRICSWYANKFFPNSAFRIDGVCIDIYPDDSFAVREYKNISYA